MKTSNLFITLIILLISGSAFVMGFIHNSQAEQIDEIQNEIELWLDIEQEITAQVNFVVTQDLFTVQLAQLYQNQGYQLATEYSSLNATLTNAQQSMYTNQLVNLLTTIIFTYQSTNIVELHERTENNAQVLFYEYSYATDDGPETLEFFIDTVYFDAVFADATDIRSVEQFIDNYPSGVKTVLLADSTVQGIDTIEMINPSGLWNPYRTILNEVESKIAELQVNKQELETVLDQIAAFVSISTVAVILSGTVSSRRDQQQLRSYFNEVRIEINPELEIDDPESNALNFLIIVAAGIISLLALGVVLTSQVLL